MRAKSISQIREMLKQNVQATHDTYKTIRHKE